MSAGSTAMNAPTLAELAHSAAAETRVALGDVERVVGFLARFGLIEVDVADHGGFRQVADCLPPVRPRKPP
jgi:hypothetical protein